MGKLADHFTTYLWERSLKPLLERMDQWDLAFLAVVLIVGYGQKQVFWDGRWSFRWEGYFNKDEKLLWMALLLVATVAWFGMRYSPQKLTNPVRLILRASLLSVLLIAWGYGWWSVYQVPVFAEGAVGFSLARLHGDSGDRTQHAIHQILNQVIAEFADDRIKLHRLPVRLDTHDAARDMGWRTNAALVLWGSSAPQDQGLAELNLTVARTRALPPTKAPLEPHYLRRNDSDQVTVIRGIAGPLVFFLAGYERYFAGDYPIAVEWLKRANAHAREDRERGSSPLEVLRGSIHFYLANALLACVETDVLRECGLTNPRLAKVLATELYMRAAEIVAEPSDRRLERSIYIEALNNLAFLEMKEHQDRALRWLKRGETVCSRRTTMTTSCLYVHYNLGTLYRDERRYADAAEQFQIVLKREADERTSAPITDGDDLLRAHSYQNLAYSYAMMAEYVNGAAERRAQYDLSREHMERAIAILRDRRHGVSEAFNITRARIMIGLDDWRGAVELLADSTLANSDHAQDMHLLLAVAYECENEPTKSAQHFKMFRSLAQLQKLDEGGRYYDRVTNRCRSHSSTRANTGG
jgi:tetratricopeptide (TPR) repeat protein